jgi:serine/threonine protein kinase
LRERFAREARSVASLHHLHIVTIFDVGEYEGHPFIAMEYIRGETLQALIRARLVLSIARKLEILEQLCEGLAFAHRAGIIHRDVKPANMILQLDGSLKILDFGIARIAKSSGMTHAGMLIGTLNYMSPEQVSGQVADNRSDVFAVGAVMYELLSYRQAFPGGIEDGILYRLMNESPAPLEDACPGLDPEIFRIGLVRSKRSTEALSRSEIDGERPSSHPDASADRRHDDECVGLSGQRAARAHGTRPAVAEPSRRAVDREEFSRRRARQIDEYGLGTTHCRTETTRRGFPRVSKR